MALTPIANGDSGSSARTKINAGFTLADATDARTTNVTNTSDTNKPVSTAQQTALDLKANLLDTYNLQTGTTYTLAASDNGKVVDLANASAITVTVPNSLAVGFNCIIAQSGAGQVTIAAGSGATLNAYPSGGIKTAGQWAKATVSIRTNAGGAAAVAVLGGGVV